MNATVKEVRNDCVEIAWEPAEEAEKYHVGELFKWSASF